MKSNRKTNNNSFRKNKKKGFTLIELMAVIAIVAILAAAFIPKISGFINESKKVAVLNQASKVVATYESLKIRSDSSITINDTVELLSLRSNGLLILSEINKISKDITIQNCINVLNSDEYSFSIDTSGILSDNNFVKKYSDIVKSK